MLAHNAEIQIQFDKTCTLRQACEYIAFGWEPTTNEKYEAYLNRYRPSRYESCPSYDHPMSEANDMLAVLFEQGRITITGIKDPGKPLWDGDDEYAISHNELVTKLYADIGYIPWEEHPRVQVKKPKNWGFDLEYNWVINKTDGENSYRDILIDFEELKRVCSQKLPQRHYKITLSDTGSLDFNDGIHTFHIANLNDDKKTFAWLKYCFDNPNRIILKQEIIDRFLGIKKLEFNADRITDVLRGAFKNATFLFGYCFPVRSDTQVYCRPEFTECDTDALE